MSILPDQTIDAIRGFNDLGVDIYGVICDLYIPTNLTALEGRDAYQTRAEITYKKYSDQKVWIDWSAKDFDKLRKIGVFTENELPITARFKNTPEVILYSYIKVPIRYIPDTYVVDEFEVVCPIISNSYNAEVLKRFKLAPRRVQQ